MRKTPLRSERQHLRCALFCLPYVSGPFLIAPLHSPPASQFRYVLNQAWLNPSGLTVQDRTHPRNYFRFRACLSRPFSAFQRNTEPEPEKTRLSCITQTFRNRTNNDGTFQACITSQQLNPTHSAFPFQLFFASQRQSSLRPERPILLRYDFTIRALPRYVEPHRAKPALH